MPHPVGVGRLLVRESCSARCTCVWYRTYVRVGRLLGCLEHLVLDEEYPGVPRVASALAGAHGLCVFFGSKSGWQGSQVRPSCFGCHGRCLVRRSDSEGDRRADFADEAVALWQPAQW